MILTLMLYISSMQAKIFHVSHVNIISLSLLNLFSYIYRLVWVFQVLFLQHDLMVN